MFNDALSLRLHEIQKQRARPTASERTATSAPPAAPEELHSISPLDPTPPVSASPLSTLALAKPPPPAENKLLGEEVTSPFGRYFSIDKPLDALWPAAESRLAERWRLAEGETPPASTPGLETFRQAYPHDLLLLDLETCGFAGAAIFLVGILVWDGRWRMRQFLARHPAEERAILAALWALAAQKRVLCTFNGKSFDWPTVHDRSTVHRLGWRDEESAEIDRPIWLTSDAAAILPTTTRPELLHVDWLHESRRRWRKQLPNCRLQTLEQVICGRRRVGDIPGSEIPGVYQDFLLTGDVSGIRQICHHNALDLITMLQVAICLTAGPIRALSQAV